jgi:Signal recognition particle receptor beta subunit
MAELPRLWQATVRESLVPFLPPPVTQGIRTIDSTLAVYVGPEATVTISVTLLVAWVVVALVQRWISSRTGPAIKAVVSGDDEGTTLSKNEGTYDATVLLAGPRNGGKTRLFYQLCYTERYIPTVMSLEPNVGVTTYTGDDSTNRSMQRIRYVDWPGYASVQDPSFVSIIAPDVTIVKKVHPVRVVLVVDATQPVTIAAEMLFQLFTILYDAYVNEPPATTSSSSHSNRTTPSIFVACHKKDFPKAKNDKRIKIQIRTELERLIYTAQTTMSTTTTSSNNTDTPTNDKNGWWWCPPPQPQNSSSHQQSISETQQLSKQFTLAVDLDELSFVRLFFCATTCEGTVASELMEYCQTGVVSSSETASS